MDNPPIPVKNLGVPLEDWKHWRTEINNAMVKKMATGDPGRGFVPFAEYLDYPAKMTLGEEGFEGEEEQTVDGGEAASQGTVPRNLLVYSNSPQNKTALNKNDFLNYGIPRVAKSATDRSLEALQFEVEVPESQVEFDAAKKPNDVTLYMDADTQTGSGLYSRRSSKGQDSMGTYSRRIVSTDEPVVRRRRDSGKDVGDAGMKRRPTSMYDIMSYGDRGVVQLGPEDGGNRGAVYQARGAQYGFNTSNKDRPFRSQEEPVQDNRGPGRLPRTALNTAGRSRRPDAAAAMAAATRSPPVRRRAPRMMSPPAADRRPRMKSPHVTRDPRMTSPPAAERRPRMKSPHVTRQPRMTSPPPVPTRRYQERGRERVRQPAAKWPTPARYPQFQTKPPEQQQGGWPYTYRPQ